MTSVVFDLESNGLREDADTIWCISAGPLDTDVVESWGPEELENALGYLDSFDEIIGHNIINYDLPLMKDLLGWEPRKDVKITDTLALSRLSNPDRRKPLGYTGKGGPHSLEAWGYRVRRSKPEHEDWSVFSPAMLRRNREDVEINKLTSHLISSEMSDHDWGESVQLEHDVLRIITQQEINGVYFDVRNATKLIDDLSSRVQSIDDELIPKLPITYKLRGTSVRKPFKVNGEYSRMVLDWYPDLETSNDRYVGGPFSRVEGVRLDINSIKQVKDYFLECGWKPTEWNYSKTTGERTSPKLTEDSYGTIRGHMGERIKERITLCHRRSQVQGWLDRVRPDGRLSASANTCGTPTGRMRHSNVVNVPKAADYVPYGKEMRSLFCVPEGYRLVGCDAEQLELRVLAHYMDDYLYIQEILSGDIHTHNQKLANLPTRDAAKTFIYAFIYGAGDEKLGTIVGGGQREGTAVRRDFLTGLPELKKLITKAKRASNKGWLKGLDGRKLWLRRNDEGDVMQHKALNLYIQGAGAVIMKKAMCILDEDLSKETFDYKKVLDMHDEFQYEVEEKYSKRLAELAEKAIVKAGEHFNLKIPMAGEAKIGLNWAETH